MIGYYQLNQYLSTNFYSEGTMMVKSQNRQKSSSSANKAGKLSGIAGLLDAVRIVVGAYNALKSIDAHFDGREQQGVRTLSRFARQHAKAIKEGVKPDAAAIERTIRLAVNVGNSFDDRFGAIMNDSFILFDKGMAAIRNRAPDILFRDGDKIVALQDALRAQLALDEPPYDDVIDAYKAMMTYIPTVSAEAEAVIEAERKRKRNERAVAASEAILAELDDLDID